MLIKLTSMQTEAIICHEFTDYFIRNIDNIAWTDEQRQWINMWRKSVQGHFLTEYGLIIKPPQGVAFFDTIDRQTFKLRYKTGGGWDDVFFYGIYDNLKSVLKVFICDIIHFQPSQYGSYDDFTEYCRINMLGDIFIDKVIETFIGQKPPYELSKWEKEGIHIC